MFVGLTRPDLLALVRATGCAVECGDSVFLCDPHWTAAEKEAFARITSGGQGTECCTVGWLCVRTGGSGGGMKFARHDEVTLSAAVRGFCAHFNLVRVNAVDVLPAHHVSGLMARVRCALTGGTHLPWDWKKLESGIFPSLDPAPLLSPLVSGAPTIDPHPTPWVVSLVPTQLQRLLALPAAVDWLRQFHLIFLGGGPVWPELTDAAARAQLPVSLSYGMTETAAMVTALRPAEFLAGDRSSGTPLPHACVTVTPDDEIAVSGESLFRGYFSEAAHEGPFLTDDLGRVDERGHLHVLGRRDAVIITGGKKVHPAEVEAVLRGSGEFPDVAVIGIPDPEWGQAVVACYPANPRPPDLARAVAALASHQRPKRFIPIPDWPRNALGKLDRAELLRRIAFGKPS